MNNIFVIPRLTYEILNVSAEEIADTLGLTVAMVQDEIEKYKWTRWFPDEDENIFSLDTKVSEDEELLEGENLFTVRADQFLDKNRKRLQVFSLAKDLALAERYADLEVSLVTKAREAVQAVDSTNVKDLKDIASIFKDLAKNLQSVNSAVSFAKDEQGLPTVIIRDLSGV